MSMQVFKRKSCVALLCYWKIGYRYAVYAGTGHAVYEHTDTT